MYTFTRSRSDGVWGGGGGVVGSGSGLHVASLNGLELPLSTRIYEPDSQQSLCLRTVTVTYMSGDGIHKF